MTCIDARTPVVPHSPPPASASVALQDTLTGPPRRGVVGGAGPKAAYLYFSDAPHEVVALVGPAAVRLPIAVQVPELPPLRAGMTAEVGHGSLWSGPFGWRVARWWDPRPRLDAAALVAAGPAAAALTGRLRSGDLGVDLATARTAARRLAFADPDAACRLLGAGPGFTPAGDDVVAGALAVLALTHALAPDAAARVHAAAVDRTTAVSAALLASAAHGETVPAAARLLTALATGAPDDAITACAAALREVGGTSGTALLFGMAVALEWTCLRTRAVRMERP